MSAGRYAQSQAKFSDSQAHGAGCELILVEGDSAARSVLAVRDARTQAVLPLQGKPLNAWRADAAKVRDNILYTQIAEALGLPDAVMDEAADGPHSLRFERVVLLFDPDADGIHITALMLLYFARWLPVLLECGQVWIVRPPMFTLTNTVIGAEVQAYSPEHRDALKRAMGGQADCHRHLGLGSLPPELLRRTCVDVRTRQSRSASVEDVEAVLANFSPG